MITIVTGHDGVGKSTLCNALLKKDNTLKYYHFSNPKDLNDGKKQYFDFLNNVKKDENYLCDRFHEGEHIYAPVYRHYESNYLSELEDKIMNVNNFPFLIYLTADLKDIEKRLDIRGEDFVKKEHYALIKSNFQKFMLKQTLPFTIIDTSKLNRKQTIDSALSSIKKYKLMIQYMDSEGTLARGNINAKYMTIINIAGTNHQCYLRVLSRESYAKKIIHSWINNNDYLNSWFTNVNLDNEESINNVKNQIKIIKPKIVFTYGINNFESIFDYNETELVSLMHVYDYFENGRKIY